MPDVSVTWLGHAAFRVDSPSGKRVYVDPWLDNPKCPDGETALLWITMLIRMQGIKSPADSSISP